MLSARKPSNMRGKSVRTSIRRAIGEARAKKIARGNRAIVKGVIRDQLAAAAERRAFLIMACIVSVGVAPLLSQ
jgi:hypothetical protein